MKVNQDGSVDPAAIDARMRRSQAPVVMPGAICNARPQVL
jgi:hypothetical protein